MQQGVDVKLNLGCERSVSGQASFRVTFCVTMKSRRVLDALSIATVSNCDLSSLRNAMVKEVEEEKVHLKTKVCTAMHSVLSRC